MKKYKVLDLFCGAGGLSLGFELAGFEIVGGVEWDSAAMETHKKNFETKIDFCGDIKEISDDELKTKIKNIDVIIGGPPCQGFSSANRLDKGEDERNKLFYEYLRFVKVLNPKIFVIENVRQILTKDKGYAMNRILEITKDLGYTVKVDVLLASDYGVPQERRRAIFVGVRNDLSNVFDFNDIIKSTNKHTVYDAIADICYPELNLTNDFLSYAKNAEFLANHNPTFPNAKVQSRISHVPQGGNWKDVPDELWDTIRSNRHSSAYKRLSFNEPSITIDTGHMNYFHPVLDRTPTVRESARLQSFPDSFIFYGTKSQQLRQVGNAVPPLMSKAVALQVKKVLKGEKNNERT